MQYNIELKFNYSVCLVCRSSLDEIFRIFSGVKMFDLYVRLKGVSNVFKGGFKIEFKMQFLQCVFYASEFKKLEKIFLFLYFKNNVVKVVK